MTTATPPPDRHLLGRFTVPVLALVLAALAAGGIALWRATGQDRKPAGLDAAFVYDVDRYRTIPPERIGYREVARFPTGLAEAAALAVGPDDRIAAGGDGKVLVFSAAGALLATVPVPGPPCALAAAPGGDLLVATADRVGRCPYGEPLEFFATVPGEKARITSVAADAGFLYAADAGSRRVWCFDHDGAPRGTVGDRDLARRIPGFNVPSPYFDLLVAPDGLLRVVDPGRHRIDAFTDRGDLELSWGKASYDLEGFSGCCNPSHIALLPDGRFVTSEKGIPRVKVHDVDGTFVTAVAGAAGLDTESEPCDVAVDGRGRIVLLDPGKGVVRVFEPTEEEKRGD